MYAHGDIKEVHPEITQRCNAACPCVTLNPMVVRLIDTLEMTPGTTPDDIKTISPNFIKQLNTMYMCGNSGDPKKKNSASDTLEVFLHSLENIIQTCGA